MSLAESITVRFPPSFRSYLNYMRQILILELTLACTNYRIFRSNFTINYNFSPWFFCYNYSMKIILLLLFPIISFSQIMSPNKMLLRTPIWSVLELNDKNSNYLQPGNEVTVKFQNKSTCVVEVSRVVKKIALVDISECERVIEINQLIPKSAKIKREYSPVWFRPDTGLEKKLFPLNKDTPLIIGRLRSQVVINILERTNYKSYYGKEFQFWYKIKTKDLVGWLPDEALFSMKRIMKQNVKIRLKN